MCHLAARTKGKFNLFFLSRNRIAGIEKTSMALSFIDRYKKEAGLHWAVGSMSDSRARGLEFDSQSSHLLLFFLLLIQESMCT